MAARFTQCQRCITAAIEKQHRLLAAEERGRECLAQRRRQPCAGFAVRLAQVDHPNLGHVGEPVARREFEPVVSPARGIDIGFQRRRGAGQQDGALLDMSAHDRHIARIVDDAVFLLVSLFVFFIDDDEAEFVERQEQSRTRAHDDSCFAAHDGAVISSPVLLRQIGMPFCRAAAETFGEALEELHRERDLRQQDQCLLAAAKRFGHRIEIGFCFAGARHAVQQRHRIFSRFHVRRERVRGGFLFRVECRVCEDRIGNSQRRKFWQFGFHQCAAFDQPAHHLRRDVGLLCESGHAARQPVAGTRQHARPRRRHALGRHDPARIGDAGDFRLECLSCTKCKREHRAGRRKRVARHPIDEIAQRFW